MSATTTWKQLAAHYEDIEQFKAGYAPTDAAEDWRIISIINIERTIGAALMELKGFLTEDGYTEIPVESRRTKVERINL